MIRAVLDTNVLLASLLSRRGAAFEIMERLRRGEWRLVLSNHLLLEYEEVLKRNAAVLGLTLAEVEPLPELHLPGRRLLRPRRAAGTAPSRSRR